MKHKFRLMLKTIFIKLFLLVIVVNALSSPTPEKSLFLSQYYVAPDGSDRNPGTEELPFRTIQKAARSAAPGSTVYIKQGRYNERVVIKVSGNSEQGFITFRPYMDDKVIIDGSGLRRNKDTNGDCIIYMEDKNYIRIQGFEITDITVKDGSGIRIYGSGSYIEILDNRIHEIRGKNAMGITVYGTDGKSVNNLLIDGNEVYNCDPAPSEALSLNGNVEEFQISNNIVHDVNNIGIDMIGGEDWLGKSFVRNGICSANTVYRTRSPYGGGYAAGIYVDGASNIIIERNRVFECDMGIEVGAENPGVLVRNITVRNNLIYNNDKVGLIFGGFTESKGRVTNCYFINNTLYNNNKVTAEGEIWIQYAYYNEIRNNIIYTTPNKKGQVMLIQSYEEPTVLVNILDNNLYFVNNKGTKYIFTFKKHGYDEWEDYRQATGQDENSLFINPLFEKSALEELDFYLQEDSPAIDAGIKHKNMGDLDFHGKLRVNGPQVDIGAVEY